jgi:hypothetical protein
MGTEAAALPKSRVERATPPIRLLTPEERTAARPQEGAQEAMQFCLALTSTRGQALDRRVWREKPS